MKHSITSACIIAVVCVCCAGPLTAVINAQSAAAITTVSFINSVGFDENRNAIMVNFYYNVTNTTTGELQQNGLSVPFLTIVPVPYIRVR